MKKSPLFFFACCLFNFSLAYADTAPLEAAVDTCHPAPRASVPQYIIGYGSLMEDASRQRSVPQAVEVVPVRVQGIRRAWVARGGVVGFSTTFLGAYKDAASTMNAAMFALTEAGAIATLDARENGYCRAPVNKNQINTLDLSALPDGEIWVYVSKKENILRASPAYPIVQSYVDVFLTGCLQIEAKFQLEGFARECISSTHDWSKEWVNDRIFPRRPFVYQPRAGAIDRLLSQEVPVYFGAIHFE